MINKQQYAKNKLLEFIQLIKDGAFDEELKNELEVVYNDWRLPTMQELLTLVDYTKINPACDLEDTKLEHYWSSTPCVSSDDSFWDVGFYYGYTGWNPKSTHSYVRCVRDGKDRLEWSATSEKPMTLNQAIKYANNLVAPVYYKR